MAIITGTVHVGIATYNSLADLPGCLSALQAQTYPDVSVTVLDNASSDGTVGWLRQAWPQIRLLINRENAGFARAQNHILSHCNMQEGDFYLPLNPDVILTSRYIEQVVAALRHSGAGWATGKLLLMDDTGAKTQTLYSAGHGLRRDGYGINIGYGLPDGAPFDESREVFGAPGAAPLLSSAFINALAPDGELFDAAMFMYGEDTDLDWRARRKGWHCWYVAQATGYHRGSEPRGLLRAQALANRYLSVIKNATMIDLLAYNLPLIVLHCTLRLMITPRTGFHLVRQLLRHAPAMWRKRGRSAVPRAALLDWFRWSEAQPTAQPVSWIDRMFSFRR